MEQLTAFLKKYKKWVITIAILIVAGFGAKTTYEYHQNNIISQMDVKFSGYNGEGTAEIKKKDKFLNDTALRIFKLNGVRTDIAKKLLAVHLILIMVVFQLLTNKRLRKPFLN
ncbi:hypothetical protein [Pediococcus pentosaceus]|uniref:hypothetical protein n=1 Tax=Pediococcus pentosaceus TaxID=1255 RepID=UPI001330EBE9|nr:hypothetical protein [Pediococcus pentosaceus]